MQDREGGRRTVQGVLASAEKCETGQCRIVQDSAGWCTTEQKDAGLFKECLKVLVSARQCITVTIE